jgi:phosphoglycolate phosphatase
MNIKKPQMILIDVDGTLIDSVPDLAYCVDEMMKALGKPECGIDKVRNWVGNGVDRLIKRALVGQLDGEPDDVAFQQALPLFMDLYADNVSERSVLFEGVREALDYFKQQNYTLGCVTNKAEQFTIPLLTDLGIHDDFEYVVCGDTLPKKKPDPLPLLHSAEHFKIIPENALMIGDSVSDVKAARAAGFQIVCMSYGYNHGEDIRDYNPDLVVDSMMELKGIL